MTEAQKDAVCKAWDILTEHFDRVLLVMDFDSTHSTDAIQHDAHAAYWHGGSMAALGMSIFAQDRLLHSVLHSGEKASEPEGGE